MPSKIELSRRDLIALAIGGGTVAAAGGIATLVGRKGKAPTPEQTSTKQQVEIKATPPAKEKPKELPWEIKIDANFLKPEGDIARTEGGAPVTFYVQGRLFTQVEGKLVEKDPKTAVTTWEFPLGRGAVMAANEEILAILSPTDFKIHILSTKTQAKLGEVEPAFKQPEVMQTYYRGPGKVNGEFIIIPRGKILTGDSYMGGTYDGFLVVDKTGKRMLESTPGKNEKVVAMVGERLVVDTGATVDIIDLKKSARVLSIPGYRTPNLQHFSTNGEFLAIVETDKVYPERNFQAPVSLAFYNMATGQKLTEKPLNPRSFFGRVIIMQVSVITFESTNTQGKKDTVVWAICERDDVVYKYFEQLTFFIRRNSSESTNYQATFTQNYYFGGDDRRVAYFTKLESLDKYTLEVLVGGDNENENNKGGKLEQVPAINLVGAFTVGEEMKSI